MNLLVYVLDKFTVAVIGWKHHVTKVRRKIVSKASVASSIEYPEILLDNICG